MLIIYPIKYVDKAQREWKFLRSIDKSLHRIDKYLPRFSNYPSQSTHSIVIKMARKSKGRGNRARGRENNEQDRQQSQKGRSENGAAAVVSDLDEKRKLDEEKGEETLWETAGPSERTNTSRSQQSAYTALSTEVKSEEVNAIPSARSQDERSGLSELSLRSSTDPFVKPAGNTEEYVGEGCEAKFGFYQSVRPSQWKVMLVNIDG